MPSSSIQRVPPSSQDLPRRSSLVRRRDDDDDTIPSSPSKRPRVTWDSDVEVRTVGENEKAPELILEEVRIAFRDKASGDWSRYERLKAVYNDTQDNDTQPTPTTLRNYTIALLANVSSLNKTTTDLVRKVISSEWLGRESEYVVLFMRLLGSLNTAQPIFLESSLNMLVENLTAQPACNRELMNEPTVSKVTIYGRVHKTLGYLMQLIPSASSIIRRILNNHFPQSNESRRFNIVFTNNILGILRYAPELRSDILSLITDRVVKVDVQVQIDIEDLEEDEISDHLEHGMSRAKHDYMEDLNDESDTSDDDSESDEEEDPEVLRTRDITQMVGKLDAILDILFSFYNADFSSSKTSNSATNTIDQLLSQFLTMILPTHRSRHTQFLLFHFVQQSPTHIDHFVGTCVSTVLDRKQPPLLRQNAAAYLASFVARGIHVPSSIVREVFDYISSELNRLRKEHLPKCQGPDLRRYASYYCLVQALMYMFCFRWRDLEVRNEEVEKEDDLDVSFTRGHQWKPGVKEVFSANIFSKLNPLKVCSPAIVIEFARVAQHLGVVYVYHLLETNKRIKSRNAVAVAGCQLYGQLERDTALSISHNEGHQHLDAYFPFDPYHLPRSKKWIEGDYRSWKGLPGLEEEKDDSDSEDDEELPEDDTASDRT
ncbi:uncharacterized protein KY384_008444 [Bacidia gigantensis]|uniref:uncharacterized protein n=1 Tax=Bacidia gigantensis TaxID=2732470 RepID=UPI001D03DEC1|nr:uncharacterized protein KY384_008444 [Bacidia gigantensis]KAG8527015.1 hypothetical protein KY384_008444 [Bacidia gigantensis]